MVVKFNHLLPAMPELGMGLPNAYRDVDISLSLCNGTDRHNDPINAIGKKIR